MKSRRGTGLVELLTSLMLLGLVSAACAAILQSQARLVRHYGELTARSEALRATRALLRHELRDAHPVDVRAVGPDSLAARIFRGVGLACARAEQLVALRYEGLRLPEPDKDSLLVVGEERALAFRASTALLTCATQGDERTVVIEADGLRPGAVVLWFESGAYHLAGNALRYRRAGEGRQPLTDELIDHRLSSVRLVGPGLIQLHLRARDGAAAVEQIRLANQ